MSLLRIKIKILYSFSVSICIINNVFLRVIVRNAANIVKKVKKRYYKVKQTNLLKMILIKHRIYKIKFNKQI